MKSKKSLFSLLIVWLTGSLSVGVCVSIAAPLTPPANKDKEQVAPVTPRSPRTPAPPAKVGIVKTYGAGYYEIKPNGLQVLHLKGASHERGYQYGALLKDEIETSLKSGMTLFMVKIGDGDCDKGLQRIIQGKEDMEQFIPPEFKQEMRGIADALADAGSNLTYDDIVMWNTVNDSYTLHGGPCEVEDNIPSGKRHPYPANVSCTTVRASGEATKTGRLIMGKNMDWHNTPEMAQNPVVLVVDPTDGGYGYLAPVYPGWIGCIEGMNEKGIGMGLQISRSDVETMKGVGWHFQTLLILKYADSLDDAINILTVYPRTCGNITHVGDGKTGQSVVIEHTANDLALRYQVPGRDILWTTNHFNCYPGWEGYTGTVNMPAKQVKAQNLNISTIEAWQETIPLRSKGRFERERQLLNIEYGQITPEYMIKLISDRYCMKEKQYVGWDKDAYTIAVHGEAGVAEEVFEDIAYYKSDRKGQVIHNHGNIWSLVMVPLTGDLHITMSGPMPTHREPFRYINLLEELKSMR